MLTIYRASAGSGKTYQLALEYLKLLFVSDNAYEHILAVTFTNKATGEMKRRIIDELDILAHDVSASGYAGELGRVLNLSPQLLQARAFDILTALLHDYSAFNISTIDRFFQQTTRAFTREIGLQGGYNLELDNDPVLSQAIDRMMFELENPEKKELLKWLLQYSENKVEDGLSWNLRSDIGKLGREIFKETYKLHSREVLELTADKKILSAYRNELNKVRSVYKQFIIENSRIALQMMDEASLKPEDFKGGSRSPFVQLKKWESGEVDELKPAFVRLHDSLDNWLAKSTKPPVSAAIEQVYASGVNHCVGEIIRAFPLMISAEMTVKHLYTLGILSDIDRHVREYEKEHNILLLSDTTELLNKIIDGSDTPFVYEKIGNRIDHYMIDEFQDTSGMQWSNFYPLVRDSVDKHQKNLIVGDVKQSIYRWRSSDWKLLHEELKRSFDDTLRTDNVLDQNWRSATHIVSFNNAFFTLAAQTLQSDINDLYDNASVYVEKEAGFNSKITDAYADIYQYVPSVHKEKSGHVNVRFMETDDDQDWSAQVLQEIPEQVKALQDRGFSLKDIAILVRSQGDGARVANALLRYKEENTGSAYRFDVISSESLYLNSVPVIRLIIGVLNYLHNPEVELNRILAVYEYETSRNELTPEAGLGRYFLNRTDTMLLFPGEIAGELDRLKTLPLFEMCEGIIGLFPSVKPENDGVFIQAFLDLVLDFTTNHTADVSSFLEWWQEYGYRKTISTPDTQDAVRIMTIHKSKGLGFKAIIVPFCDWDMDNRADILWCEPHYPPFNQLPLVPVIYSKKMAGTIYATDYFNEKIQAYIDNLNLAYVAFTRAKEELIIYAPRPKNDKSVKSISSLLYNCLANQTGGISDTVWPLINLQAAFDPSSLIYETGAEWMTRRSDDNPIEECTMPDYHSIEPGQRLQLRLHGKGFFGDREERKYGNLMHEILSGIRFEADVDKAVNRFILDGLISVEEGLGIAQKIKTWVSSDQTSRWFAPGVRILNEAEILQADGVFLRPDRVVFYDGRIEVIDYKFGNVERKSYIRQVSRYVDKIKSMGYADVHGYIWYVELEKIVGTN